MKAISLFSGCGGFDKGAQLAGLDIIWANDIYVPASKFYKTYLPEVEFVTKDIKRITDFPEADIVIGCYPCTGFSTAARRRWKAREFRDLNTNDTNFLFKEFLRAIKIVKPKAIFVENVRGMLSANNGQFLNEQILGFSRLGFTRIKPLLLNATDFGVAQSRQRIFFACIHDDYAAKETFLPKPTHGIPGIPVKVLIDVIDKFDPWPKGEFYDGIFHGHYLTRNRKRAWNQPSYTIVADSHHVPLHPSGPQMEYISKDKWKLGDGLNRRLSWRECARIQGLPDIDDIDCTLTDKYKVVGNSVPPLLAKALVEPIVSYLKSN